MNKGFMPGLFSVALALSMSFTGTASADTTTLPTCDENSLWSLAEETVTDEFGIMRLQYLCATDGWVLVGVDYCSFEGNCSSN